MILFDSNFSRSVFWSGRIRVIAMFRRPTGTEVRKITSYMTALHIAEYSAAGSLMSVFLVIGIILLGSGLMESSTPQASSGAVFTLGGLILILYKIKIKMQLYAYRTGWFLIAEGHYTRKEHSKIPGMRQINFVSTDGETFDGPFEVDHIELKQETPLLLVWEKKSPGGQRTPGKHDILKVFTPYMLENPHRKHYRIRKKKRKQYVG